MGNNGKFGVVIMDIECRNSNSNTINEELYIYSDNDSSSKYFEVAGRYEVALRTLAPFHDRCASSKQYSSFLHRSRKQRN